MSKTSIYHAMGSFAYAIAMADGEIQDEEKETIRKLALEQFDLTDIGSAWINNMFEELKEKGIGLEEAYQYALDTLESTRYSFEFDEVMKRKCVQFIERTAESFEGIEYTEREMIDRLKKDLAAF